MKKLFSTSALLSLLLTGSLRADEVYTFVVKKQEEKSKTRWSLSEWLDTRDKMRLQDLWLALHSPSPYEFFIGGSAQWIQPKGGANETGAFLQLGAYASIIGLEAQYLKSTSIHRLQGLLHLRLVGYQDQGTHLNIDLGLRQESYRSPLAGASLCFYLNKHFGIEGLYQHAFSSTPTSSGLTISGDHLEGGGFIDFSFVRTYINYVTESDSTSYSRSGVNGGIRLYF